MTPLLSCERNSHLRPFPENTSPEKKRTNTVSQKQKSKHDHHQQHAKPAGRSVQLGRPASEVRRRHCAALKVPLCLSIRRNKGPNPTEPPKPVSGGTPRMAPNSQVCSGDRERRFVKPPHSSTPPSPQRVTRGRFGRCANAAILRTGVERCKAVWFRSIRHAGSATGMDARRNDCVTRCEDLARQDAVRPRGCHRDFWDLSLAVAGPPRQPRPNGRLAARGPVYQGQVKAAARCSVH
jgi:hypothetical protein